VHFLDQKHGQISPDDFCMIMLMDGKDKTIYWDCKYRCIQTGISLLKILVSAILVNSVTIFVTDKSTCVFMNRRLACESFITKVCEVLYQL